jgi:heme oxygenase (biliverdin-IX-beta and delta-forming)
MWLNHTPELANLLRESTRTDHHALDHHPVLAVLVRRSVTLDEYASALAALHGAHNAIENILHGFAPSDLFPGRTPDIEADLCDLGRPPFPLSVAIPYPDTPAARLGMMYVIEGSNLGGRVIANHLSQILPKDVPQRFFGKADATERWRHFWQFALQQCSAEDYPWVVKAARDTFGFFRAHLDSHTGTQASLSVTPDFQQPAVT